MREGDEERTKTWIRNLLDGYECGLEEVCPFESLYPPIYIIPLHYPKWTLILPFHQIRAIPPPLRRAYPILVGETA